MTLRLRPLLKDVVGRPHATVDLLPHWRASRVRRRLEHLLQGAPRHLRYFRSVNRSHVVLVLLLHAHESPRQVAYVGGRARNLRVPQYAL